MQAGRVGSHQEQGGGVRRAAVSLKKKHYFDSYSTNLLIELRPPAARVSGVVEESPGHLEYEVALFRESDKSNNNNNNNAILDSEVPVEQAVPIGTKLQLRASINDNSGENVFTLQLCKCFGHLIFSCYCCCCCVVVVVVVVVFAAAAAPFTAEFVVNIILTYANSNQIFFAAWRHVKLTEVTISSDPKDAYAPGHIKLVQNG